MSIKISKEEIKRYEKLKTLSQITLLKEKISLFRKKYDASIEDFRKNLEPREENFDEWDDYIEWNAAEASLTDLITKLKEIKNAKDIKLV